MHWEYYNNAEIGNDTSCVDDTDNSKACLIIIYMYMLIHNLHAVLPKGPKPVSTVDGVSL